MTVSVYFPEATVPLPNKQGYVLKPRPNLLRTEMDQGAARQRRASTQKPTEVSVTWLVTTWQLMLLQGFHEHRAMDGAEWFGMTLATYVGLAMCEARFKGELSQPKRAGHLWDVSATLEVREIPRLSESDYTLLAGEDGDALLAAVAAWHHLVHSELWS